MTTTFFTGSCAFHCARVDLHTFSGCSFPWSQIQSSLTDRASGKSWGSLTFSRRPRASPSLKTSSRTTNRFTHPFELAVTITTPQDLAPSFSASTAEVCSSRAQQPDYSAIHRGQRHDGSYMDLSRCTNTVLASFPMQSCHAARVESAESNGLQMGLSLFDAELYKKVSQARISSSLFYPDSFLSHVPVGSPSCISLS